MPLSGAAESMPDYSLDPHRVVYYETDYGTIDVSTTDADTLRSIITEMAIDHEKQRKGLQDRLDDWMEWAFKIKPRCWICKLFAKE